MEATQQRFPQTLIEAVRYFTDLDVCVEFVAGLRWTDGPICPDCGNPSPYYLKTRRVWKCKNKTCNRQFSVKVGTIFEDSPIPLDKWLTGIWLIANAKNGISSHEIARSLGITQKSAWFLLHRIRLAMQTGTFEKFSGEVEADETYVGGLARNMHKKRRTRVVQGKPVANKTPVLGMMQREPRRVVAKVLPNTTGPSIHPEIRKQVDEGTNLYTDSHKSYVGLRDDYEHAIIDHAMGYVDGRVSTNGLENFFSLLKRGLHGTYVSVEPWHLSRYVDEQVFRFNEREKDDAGRFVKVLGMIAGRRLTYAEVTGK